MTNYIFPKFQGLSFKKTKTPCRKTKVDEAESGVECRVQKWRYPRFKIELYHNFMTDNSVDDSSLIKGDLEILQGFFNSVGGKFNDFLYRDDTENTVENQSFGFGNGTTKSFPLVRSFPNWVEPVNGIISAPHIYIDGEETTDFSFSNYGMIVFNTAPPQGAVLTWSGEYYFRVRFQDDEIELTRGDWEGIWEDITVKLITVK